MAKINPAHIERYIKDAQYPASKSEIVGHAQKQGADQDTISVLQSLPDRRYESLTEVNKAVSEKAETVA